MTPKVIARPIAARSRTEDAESPYQRFCATRHMASRVWIEARAVSAAVLTAGSVACRARSSMRLCASSLPRSFKVAIAESRSCGEALALVAKIEARASLNAVATLGSLSFASCASTAGSALASRVLNTSRAAASRFSGSELASVSDPIAPSMATRSALLTRTFLKAATLSAGIGLPVLALRIAPVVVL